MENVLADQVGAEHNDHGRKHGFCRQRQLQHGGQRGQRGMQHGAHHAGHAQQRIERQVGGAGNDAGHQGAGAGAHHQCRTDQTGRYTEANGHSRDHQLGQQNPGQRGDIHMTGQGRVDGIKATAENLGNIDGHAPGNNARHQQPDGPAPDRPV